MQGTNRRAEKEKAGYAYKAPGRIVLCKYMRKEDGKVHEEKNFNHWGSGCIDNVRFHTDG